MLDLIILLIVVNGLGFYWFMNRFDRQHKLDLATKEYYYQCWLDNEYYRYEMSHDALAEDYEDTPSCFNDGCHSDSEDDLPCDNCKCREKSLF